MLPSLYILPHHRRRQPARCSPLPLHTRHPVVDHGMARRGSAMTVVSLRLTDDSVDPGSGLARLAPIEVGPVNDDAEIAPWLEVPVSD